MAAPTRWPLPLALDDSAERHWIAWQVAQSGSAGWHGSGPAQQPRLTLALASEDATTFRDRVGAGSVVLNGARSRFTATGSGVVGLLVRAVWDFLDESKGRHVFDALAPTAWADVAYCAFERCPAPAEAGAVGFCDFHLSVWCRAWLRPAPEMQDPRGCVCGDLFGGVVHGPAAARRRALCDDCASRMTQLHRVLRTALASTPASEWAQTVAGRWRDASFPDLEQRLGTIGAGTLRVADRTNTLRTVRLKKSSPRAGNLNRVDPDGPPT